MDDRDLAQYIDQQHIEATLVRLEEETATVQAAAAAVGVHPDRIGKSILFLADGQPVLVIANGTSKIGYKRLADHLGINRKRLKLANADQVVEVTGYHVGTVPPFGHQIPLRTVIEAEVLRQKELYAGGGAVDCLVKISAGELQRVTEADVFAFRM